jgi:hypothetical protein
MATTAAVKSDVVQATGVNYCDQPFVSETTRCVSNDFIEINDSSGHLCLKDKEGEGAT